MRILSGVGNLQPAIIIVIPPCHIGAICRMVELPSDEGRCYGLGRNRSCYFGKDRGYRITGSSDFRIVWIG